VDGWWRYAVFTAVLKIDPLETQVSTREAFRNLEIDMTATTPRLYYESIRQLVLTYDLMPREVSTVARIHVHNEQTITTGHCNVVPTEMLFGVAVTCVVNSKVLLFVPRCWVFARCGALGTTITTAHRTLGSVHAQSL
jgi:hypothetical protein